MKKLLATLLASTMAFSAIAGLVACGDNDEGGSKKVSHELSANLPTITDVNNPLANQSTDKVPACTIDVWAPEGATETYKELANKFKTEYQGGKYSNVTIRFTAVAEGDTETKLATDPTAGADVFFFEAGQISNMVSKNLLQPLSSSEEGAYYTKAISERDAKSWYEPVVYNGYCYAFPTTSDNGWFLWYDSDVYSETDIQTLDKMVEIAKSKNKGIMFDYGNGWYISSFFQGAGCTMDYNGSEYVTDVDGANGLAAGKAIINYLSPDKNKGADGKTQTIIKPSVDMNSEIPVGLNEGTLAAGFIGTWIGGGEKTYFYSDTKGAGYTEKELENAKAGTAAGTYVVSTFKELKDNDGNVTGYEKNSEGTLKAVETKDGQPLKHIVAAMKSNIKTAKCPTFTMDGQQKQMGSFMGGKYCGVNPHKTNQSVSMALANYFTNEAGQAARFKGTEAGPTNVNVANSAGVKANAALSALAAQNNAGGYVQLSQSSGFWDAMAAFGNAAASGEATLDNVQEQLNNLATAMRK